MAGRFSIEAVFKAVDKITAPVTRMQNRVGKLTRSMSKGLSRANKTVEKFSSGLKKAAIIGTASLVLMGGALFDIIDVGADFGRAIGSAAAKFPEDIKRGTAAFKELENAARKVGKETEFTSVQAAGGLNFLAKAGFKAKDAIAALPEIVDFATSSELDFATAADIASDALGAFGLDSKDSEKKFLGLKRVMDVMGLAANKSNVSVQELFESVKESAPVATAAGVSIETFSATMAFLASNGIKASKAGTAAKNITLALAGVGNKAAEVFSRLNIPLADEKGKLRDQFDVLDQLREKLAGFGQKQRITIIEDIFGKIPIASATKLLSGTTEAMRKTRMELEKAEGSNKRIAKFIRNDVRGSLDSLSSAVEGVKISIFTMNKGPIKDIIDGMTKWVRANEKLIASGITSFITKIIDNFKNIVKWVKRIGIAIGIFIALVAVLKTFILVMTAVNIVMALNPIGLLVISIIAVIAGITALLFWWDDLSSSMKSFGAIAATLLGPITAIAAGALMIIDAWEPVKAFFTDLWAGIVKDFKTTMDTIDIFGIKKDYETSVNTLKGLFADDENQENIEPRRNVSPEQRIANSIEEKRSTEKSEVTIKDETQKAIVSGGKLGNNIKLLQTGAF